MSTTTGCDTKNYPSIDYNGTLYIQPVGSPGFTNTYTWQQAVDYCNNLDFNDCDDWFLPSKEELHAIFLNKAQVGDFSDAFYWSATRAVSYSDRALKQDFKDGSGNPTTSYDYEFLRCRCVRR